MSTIDDYVLGRHEKEYARLAFQSRLYEPMTRRLFQDAGIVPGMSVLDLGSGAGDVCMLLAEIVGPNGKVTGIDMDPDAIEHARSRVDAAGLTNVEFQCCGFGDYNPAVPVDAIAGRLVLMYQADPATALARVIRHLRPGGIAAFLELWMQKRPAHPGSVTTKAGNWIVETMQRSGAHLDAGPKLHTIFTSAGLPVPSMRAEFLMDGNADSPLFQYFADTLESLMPKAIEYGILTEGEIDLASFPAQAQAELSSVGYAMLIGPMVSAWCRTPA